MSYGHQANIQADIEQGIALLQLLRAATEDRKSMPLRETVMATIEKYQPMHTHGPYTDYGSLTEDQIKAIRKADTATKIPEEFSRPPIKGSFRDLLEFYQKEQKQVEKDRRVNLQSPEFLEAVKSADTVKPKPAKQEKVTAEEMASELAAIMQERAKLRDAAQGERSMGKTVKLFNALYDLNLTEEQGWCFMVLLKLVRASQGKFHLDDYQDQACYSLLQAESAKRDRA